MGVPAAVACSSPAALVTISVQERASLATAPRIVVRQTPDQPPGTRTAKAGPVANGGCDGASDIDATRRQRLAPEAAKTNLSRGALVWRRGRLRRDDLG